MFNKKQENQESGMAATEYIMGLVLVAVASIGVFTVFGHQIKHKLGLVAAAISGDTASYSTIKTSSDKVVTDGKILKRANTNTSMKGEDSTSVEFTKD